MQAWLLLGILSYLFYAISTSIDEYFMDNGHNPITTNTFKMFFDGIILLIIGFLFFNLDFSFELLFWSLILGGLYAILGIIYFTLLKIGDVEMIMPFFQSSTLLLVFVGSLMIFKETASFFNYIGIFLILIGVYAVLFKKHVRFFQINKIIFLTLLMVFFSTIYFLLAKKLLFDIKPINLAIMMYFSSAIFLTLYILLSKKQRKLFDVKSSKIIIASFFAAIATFLLYSALFVGLASKVYAIAGLQSVFIFIIASIFLRKKFYWRKFAGVIFVFLGIFLISL